MLAEQELRRGNVRQNGCYLAYFMDLSPAEGDKRSLYSFRLIITNWFQQQDDVGRRDTDIGII